MGKCQQVEKTAEYQDERRHEGPNFFPKFEIVPIIFGPKRFF
jgi:hypothetical protein